jgi:hypothetical protein
MSENDAAQRLGKYCSITRHPVLSMRISVIVPSLLATFEKIKVLVYRMSENDAA